MSVLEIEGLRRAYRTPDGEEQPVIDLGRYSLAPGEHAALSGKSGSGKTTLLHMIAGILPPDAGRIVIDGAEISSMSESARDRFRAQNLGYVFQSFHLLEAYDAVENVLLGMAFGSKPDRAHARGLLERLGLGERLHHRPPQLSVGQRQRVALARALANRPKLVLADEPTGNLDAENARTALGLLREVCRENGAALLVVSHDPAILESFERCDRLEELR